MMASGTRVAALLRRATLARCLLPPRAHPSSPAFPALYAPVRGMASLSKLFVGGLSFSTDERSLKDAFSVHGQVAEVKVIVDHETGRSRGFGFVSFVSEDEAEAALQKMDGQPLNGRIIRVSYAASKPRDSRGYGPGDTGADDAGFDFSFESLKEGGSWDDVLNDPVTRATLARKNPFEDDHPFAGYSNCSSAGPIHANHASIPNNDFRRNDIFGKGSTNPSRSQTDSNEAISTGGEIDDSHFKLDDFDVDRHSSAKGGGLDDLNMDGWEDILGTKLGSSNQPNKSI